MLLSRQCNTSVITDSLALAGCPIMVKCVNRKQLSANISLKKNAFRCICFCDVEIPCQKRKERKLGRIDKREHCCPLVKLFPDFFSVCV